ncbi:TetR family transcriptional regulator [Pseudomonas cavernicola]|uniref:TetR family transcriptional regulator n=1 Tax=Pseudomonas cavernicola TaxID=2320866 RepID=A0A418XB44_9PSED|nr:TetR family transcriptional regulator [Pseudomonas cavernicola]RJG09729.1 TetR family transcriptional regulator [Pseudomonas cavernicola]
MKVTVKVSPPKVVEAQGKRLLMDAALRLAAESRSLSNLGLRELAREAGLNPNTFYRHFKTVDDLGLAMIGEMAAQIRQPLRDLRRQAAQRAADSVREAAANALPLGIDLGRGRRVCCETVELFFAFVAENPQAFIIGMRELHGASPVLREALRRVMDDFADDMADDISELQLLPSLDKPAIRQVSSLISRQLFQQSLDYIEQPEMRAAICAQAQAQILMMFAGATLLQSLGVLNLSGQAHG